MRWPRCQHGHFGASPQMPLVPKLRLNKGIYGGTSLLCRSGKLLLQVLPHKTDQNAYLLLSSAGHMPYSLAQLADCGAFAGATLA